jgi:hypothetical protein
MQQQIMILHYYNVYMIHGCINQDLKPIYVMMRIYVVILTYIMKSYTLRRSNVSDTLTYIYYKTLCIESSAISLEYNHISLATLYYHIALLRTLTPHIEIYY